MYISGGENVYPAEIEALVAELDAVKECAVIGMADDKWGEVGQLFYVAKDGAEISEDEIRNALNDKIARYKYPRWVRFTDELPRTATGKVQRYKLRELLKE